MTDKRIYITHCSFHKNNSLKGSGVAVTPDNLYSSKNLQRFVRTCKEKRVPWAIFSDRYGIWFPQEKHEWYEKNPSRVNHDEFIQLRRNFDFRLSHFNEIYFYHNPGRFHKLYRDLISESRLAERIHLISHVYDIT
jgi:hypothetical protein